MSLTTMPAAASMTQKTLNPAAASCLPLPGCAAAWKDASFWGAPGGRGRNGPPPSLWPGAAAHPPTEHRQALSLWAPPTWDTRPGTAPEHKRRRQSQQPGVYTESCMSSCARPDRQAVTRCATGCESHLLLQQVGLRLRRGRLQVGGRPPPRDAAFAVKLLQPLAHLHRGPEFAQSLRDEAPDTSQGKKPQLHSAALMVAKEHVVRAVMG